MSDLFMIDIEASPLKIDCWVKVHLLLLIIVSFIPSLYQYFHKNNTTMTDYIFLYVVEWTKSRKNLVVVGSCVANHFNREYKSISYIKRMSVHGVSKLFVLSFSYPLRYYFPFFIYTSNLMKMYMIVQWRSSNGKCLILDYS